MSTSTRRPRIVIVGGGVAGLLLATRLGRSMGRRGDAEVVLVDRGPTHVWKPMLHTFAAGTWNVFQQQVQYLTHAHKNHFEFVPGSLKSIDTARGSIRLHPLDIGATRVAEERDEFFDELILAHGSQANDFNTPGVKQHCYFIDGQQQAEEFNTELRANLARSYITGERVDIAIVGGGATGVELAAELSRLMEIASAYGGIEDARERMQITLLDGSPRILSAFPENIARSAAAQLEALGISIMTGVGVVAADATGFVLQDGSRVDAHLKVWAAGICAVPPDDGQLEINRAGQLVIGENLAVNGRRHIYAIGDCASLIPQGGERPLPATAQVANQQAQHLVKHLPRCLRQGTPVPAFHFRDLGSLVSLSNYNAFGTLGRLGFFRGGFIQGKFAQISHAYLYRRHQFLLHGAFRASALWLAERANALVQPKIRIS
ncbi:NAD(P)/FAD-dependent oxidoreductase [Stenotrophomonas sp. PS02301]|uniref:NAD(P)/FAD-dependent oxidoreductase n=1 Tax=Stenotrophomonas sp. PS02301 TaxID=2991427 RepID=UPI00249B7C2E|nr:NAD(P)/FAD-dependent oxidoreductase [Stenotrophomonas sp. PS02301]